MQVWDEACYLGMFYHYRPTWPPVQKNPIGSNMLCGIDTISSHGTIYVYILPVFFFSDIWQYIFLQRNLIEESMLCWWEFRHLGLSSMGAEIVYHRVFQIKLWFKLVYDHNFVSRQWVTYSVVACFTRVCSCHLPPTKLKHSICMADYIRTTFFYLGKFLKELADNQCSSITKGSIYHIKHMSITTFYHGSGLTWHWASNWSICLVLSQSIVCVVDNHQTGAPLLA